MRFWQNGTPTDLECREENDKMKEVKEAGITPPYSDTGGVEEYDKIEEVEEVNETQEIKEVPVGRYLEGMKYDLSRCILSRLVIKSKYMFMKYIDQVIFMYNCCYIRKLRRIIELEREKLQL